jgi:putative ABC transport system permease protein
MLSNYFRTAWRTLLRYKSFSAINIFGLALGVTCSLLIMLWVYDERSVDGFHKNEDYLYQVYERYYHDGQADAAYATQGLLAGELKKVVPEIEYAASTDYAAAPGTGSNFEVEGKVSKLYGFYAGEDLLQMFSYPLLQGKAATALSQPTSIAVSRKMAEYFFGSAEAAFGKTVRFDNKEDLQVTAVFENIPASSSQRFDFLRSWSSYVKQNQWVNNWGNTSPYTYVQLRNDAGREKVEAKIKDFVYRYMQRNPGSRVELGLQPYAEKYLQSNFKNAQPAGGRIEYVKLFTIVAAFILLIACINFMNLATAQSAKRAKEVGLRKVVGAMRTSLIAQFIGEALLLTLAAVIISLVLAAMVLPMFNALTGKELEMPLRMPFFWMAIAATTIITGFVAGSYPALFLSSLKPVHVLKTGLKFKWGAGFFRKGLVVFQFSLSAMLIVGMIVVYQQMDYIQSKNLGYDRENLIYIPIEGELAGKYNLFKEEAKRLPGVMNISKMRNSPTVIEHHTGSISWAGKDPNQDISFADGVVGYDFVKTLNLQMAQGRDFSKDLRSDSIEYILNEAAVKKIGFANPVGQSVEWGNRRGMVIGVIKDFHFSSMHQEVEPLILRLDENWGWGTILVRTKAGNTGQVLSALENLCKTVNPKFPFSYQFSDQEFDKLYRSEQLVSRLSGYFAFIAIFISCLGLFGLATFTAAQRTKEIGVRKVLGATVSGITIMLSKDFLKLVLIALLIAFPAAWILMNQWLEGYAYKIGLQWWMFALAAVVTVAIAWLTVGYQSIRAALANPVKSLRAE